MAVVQVLPDQGVRLYCEVLIYLQVHKHKPSIKPISAKMEYMNRFASMAEHFGYNFKSETNCFNKQ